LGLVLKRLPPAEVKLITDMSARALLYLPDSIKGLVLAIAEQEGAVTADYTIRTAQSEGSLKVLVAEKDDDGQMRTREHEVEGPACFITTTTRAKLHDENETRLLEVALDESPEQTGRINAAQAKRAAEPPTEEQQRHAEVRVELWRTALGALEFTETINPHAPKLAEKFPTKKIRARRDFQRLLDLASARALLFQRQREVREGRVVVSEADVTAAAKLCESLTSDVPLRLRSIIDRLSNSNLAGREFTAADAAGVLGYDTDATRRQLRAAAKVDLVEETEVGKGSKPSKWKLTPSKAASSDRPPPSDNSSGRTNPAVSTDGSASSDRPTAPASPAGGVGSGSPAPPTTTTPSATAGAQAECHQSDGRTVGQTNSRSDYAEVRPTDPAGRTSSEGAEDERSVADVPTEPEQRVAGYRRARL
jgi:hypothetical protein